MTGSLEKAVKIIIEIAECDKIILFGSHAKGENKPESDYDLIVLKKAEKNHVN